MKEKKLRELFPKIDIEYYVASQNFSNHALISLLQMQLMFFGKNEKGEDGYWKSSIQNWEFTPETWNHLIRYHRGINF